MSTGQKKQYTMKTLVSGTSEPFSRKEYAVTAGESSGEAFEVYSPSGKLIAEGGGTAPAAAAEQGETEPVAEETPAAAPAKGARVITVAYNGVSKAFWQPLGRDGGVAVVETVRGVTDVRAIGKVMGIQITGSAKAVKTAELRLERLWREADEAFKTWKREDAKYRKIGRATKDARDRQYAAQLAFMTQFAKDFVEDAS